jgi:hypothetical protein
MKVSSIVLAMSFSVFACSSTRTSMVDRDGSDAADSDTAGSQNGTNDAGTGDADGSGGHAADADHSDIGGVADAKRQLLCDGEQHLRLWVLREGGGTQAAGSYVRIENGSPVLTIDGTCSYWVGAGWSEDALRRDRPFRTGTLSEADVRAIEESVPLDDVAALADCVPNSTIPDGSTSIIRTATASASCGGITSPSNPGARFTAAWTALRTIANRLWETGTPMDGALHVSAFATSGLGLAPPYTWPARPLSAFVPADGDLYRRGVSGLVDDPDAARQLHALRDQYLADKTAQPGLYAGAPHATDDSGVVFLVYMRDAIPYEDVRGLLKF